MTKHLKISSIICILTIFIILSFYSKLPDEIPMILDDAGNVNSTLSKNIFLFAFPLVGFVINIFVYGFLSYMGRTKLVEYYIFPIILIFFIGFCISLALVV